MTGKTHNVQVHILRDFQCARHCRWRFDRVLAHQLDIQRVNIYLRSIYSSHHQRNACQRKCASYFLRYLTISCD